MLENQSGTKHYLALGRPVAARVNAGGLRKKHCSAVGDKITGFDLQDSQLELHTNL